MKMRNGEIKMKRWIFKLEMHETWIGIHDLKKCMRKGVEHKASKNTVQERNTVHQRIQKMVIMQLTMGPTPKYALKMKE